MEYHRELSRLRFDRKKQGVKFPLPEIFLNYQIKNALSYAFVVRKKLLAAKNCARGGFIQPWGLKMQNARGLKI